ncbi:MAG: ATP-binding protein [Cyanobacteriota bacterium]|nr:ATP-binding protein [Cyanobacteriota bacterium]
MLTILGSVLAVNFMPHGMCYLWKPGLVWLHAISDLAIALSYFSIPAMLVYFVYKRKDTPFLKVFILFAAFIILCGIGHLMEVWTLWHPNYWTTGIERAATALVSVYTALQMATLLPQFLSLKTAEELEAINQELQQEIAERTSIEIALKHLNEELETRVEERTAELSQTNEQLQATLSELRGTQAQLIQGEKMSSLGRMVAGVSHEINNPISFIHGNLTYATEYLQNLLELVTLYQQEVPQPTPVLKEKIETMDLEFVREDALKLLKSMATGTRRIRNIVQSLRTFANLDEARVKSVNLHHSLDSVLLMLQNRLEATSHRGAIAIAKEYSQLPLVECYPQNLNQVFLDILDNAVDAIDERAEQQPIEPLISISTRLNGDNEVELRIRNNGAFIPCSIHSKLFDPFFTTKSVGKGVGLGLTTSYQVVVRQHGGRIECNCGEGKDTEFVLSLPIAIAPRTVVVTAGARKELSRAC